MISRSTHTIEELATYLKERERLQKLVKKQREGIEQERIRREERIGRKPFPAIRVEAV